VIDDNKNNHICNGYFNLVLMFEVFGNVDSDFGYYIFWIVLFFMMIIFEENFVILNNHKCYRYKF